MTTASAPLPSFRNGVPVYVVRGTEQLFRVHQPQFMPLHFSSGMHRFDTEAGTLYAALSLDGAVAETMMRQHSSNNILQHDYVFKQMLARILLNRPLRLAKAFGPGLLSMGLDANASSSQNYEWTQSIAQAIHDRPENVDGIIFRSRHNNDAKSIALFQRAVTAIAETVTQPLAQFEPDVIEVLQTAGFSLISASDISDDLDQLERTRTAPAESGSAS